MLRADLPEYEDIGLPSQDRVHKTINAARKEAKEEIGQGYRPDYIAKDLLEAVNWIFAVQNEKI